MFLPPILYCFRAGHFISDHFQVNRDLLFPMSCGAGFAVDSAWTRREALVGCVGCRHKSDTAMNYTSDSRCLLRTWTKRRVSPSSKLPVHRTWISCKTIFRHLE